MINHLLKINYDLKLKCLYVDRTYGRLQVHFKRDAFTPKEILSIRSDIRSMLNSQLAHEYLYCAFLSEKTSIIKLAKRFGFSHVTDYELNGYDFCLYIRRPNLDYDMAE